MDTYTVPGQFVGIRYPPDPVSDSADSASGGAERTLSSAFSQIFAWNQLCTLIAATLDTGQDMLCKCLFAYHQKSLKQEVLCT